MGRGLESIKPSLDWNVEKDGAKEINYDKDSYDYLFTDEELEAFRLEEAREESEAISKGIAESEMSDEELMALWGKEDLGKYTINTPTNEKTEESMEAKGMKLFDEEEFKRAFEEFQKTLEEDPIREETNAEIDRIMQQMELDW